MANQYLFPCECGRKLTVEPSQAGRTITCECGKEIELPSLREIRSLEPAPVEGSREVGRPIWGLPDQLLLIGIIFVGAGLVGSGLLWYFWPITPPEWQVDLERIREYTQDMSLEESMKLWEKVGAEKWEREDHPYVKYYRITVESYTRWLIIALVGAGIGVVLLIASLVVPSGPRSRSGGSPPGTGPNKT